MRHHFMPAGFALLALLLPHSVFAADAGPQMMPAPPDLSEIEKRAADGVAEAQSELGGLHLWGRGFNQDPEIAAVWYRKAAEQGFTEAQFQLAGIYERGMGGVAQDHAEAEKWYRKAAELGDVRAMATLAQKYRDLYQRTYNTPEGKKDKEEADRFFKMALLAFAGPPQKSTKGLAGPQQTYDMIESELRNMKRVGELEALVEKGDAAAMAELGSRYASDRVMYDAAKALALYNKAIALGNVAAIYYLGQMYDWGQGVPRDANKALELYNSAAEKGYAEAQFRAGLRTKGTPEAVAWMTKAAEQGHQPAQVMLYKIYSVDGRGAERDMAKAYFWALVSGQSEILLGRIREELSADELQEAHMKAKAWLDAHPKPQEEAGAQ